MLNVRYILLLIAVITVARIASTYPIVNSTSDEPAHISCGMEWLQFGTYTYERQHPPLARIAVALGPYLKGLRSRTKRTPENEVPAFIFAEGNDILTSDGNYWTNLTLARLGTLPFLLLLGGVTFAWGKRYFNEATGVVAVALLMSLPPILGQAELATLDLACVATVTWALYEFLRWLEEPSYLRSWVLGTSIAIAVLTKFSAIPFLLFSFLAAFVISGSLERAKLKPLLGSIVLTATVVFLTTWAGFRFSLAPILPQYGDHPSLDRVAQAHPVLGAFLIWLLNIPLPMSELLLGVRDLWRHNSIGHDSYLLGEFRTSGWWYFFLVVVTVKTPIGFLGLTAGGIGAIFRTFQASLQRNLTFVFFVAILLFSLTSHIDAGIRHILSIYPPLALVASYWCVTTWSGSSRLARLLMASLILLTMVESVQAHRDYIAYFNAFGGAHPEDILAESDLDLGQDLERLSRRLRQLKAEHVSIAYAGSAPIERFGLPRYRVLGREAAIPGYVAVSLRYLYLDYARNGGFAWLRQRKPIERIGSSINLYYLDSIP